MGLFTLTVAGGSFILIGAFESLSLTSSPPSSSPHLSLDSSSISAPNPNPTKPKFIFSSCSSSISLSAVAVLSFLVILNSFFSLFNAISSKDNVGLALQLQVIAVSSLFMLYAIMGLCLKVVPLHSKMVNLILLFAFIEEFLLFYLQRKDTIGVENRYYDLMLVPIGICVICTVIELKLESFKDSVFPKLGRGIGLVLQGTWLLQMGISFYTSWVAHGCSLHEKSRGNYTIGCKGHPEYHRARAIATLQFDCHLAFLVAVIAGVYSLVAKGNGIRGDSVPYRPIREEIDGFNSQGRFTLDSDEDGDDVIKTEDNVVLEKGSIEMSVNGFGSHN